MLVILDEMDRTVLQRRLPNNLEQICQALCAHREGIEGIAVESTYNWYWLVDGLMEAGYRVHLVNTAAVKQYEGLKYKEDVHDARWLAHLFLPVGYIYPKEARGVRDLMRKRNQLIRQRSGQILSIENMLSRDTGKRASANEIKRWQETDVDQLALAESSRLAVKSNLAVMHCLNEQIERLEAEILKKAKFRLPDLAGNVVGTFVALGSRSFWS